MITGDVIFDLPFYNAKGILTGGDIYGPRYRIAKITVEQEAEEGSEPVSEDFFEVCVWHASTCYEKTPEDMITRKTFPFDAGGREAVLAWLNEVIPEKKQI